MANVVIMMAPAIAHIIQTFRFAADLQNRGHCVTYVSHEGHIRWLIESNGFRFFHLRLCNDQSLPPSQRWNASGSDSRSFAGNFTSNGGPKARDVNDLFVAVLEGSAHRAMVEALQPDLVVFEPTLEGATALPLVAWGIPAVKVLPVLPFTIEDDEVPPLSSHYVPTSSFWDRYRCKFECAKHKYINKWMGAVTRRWFAFGSFNNEHVSKLAAHYGLSLKALAAHELDIPEIVLCPAAFDFPRSSRPYRHYLDNGVWTSSLQEPDRSVFPWSRLKSDRPVVYCSFGTQVPGQAWSISPIMTVIRAFIESRDFQVFICTKNASDFADLFPLPDHVVIIDQWIPQLSFLRCVDVHITHGGFSSVRESLECEVPMIVIPFDSDSPGNAARVIFHRLGVRVHPRQLAKSNLVQLTKYVHGSSEIRANLKLMKEAFDQQRNLQSAADFLEARLTKIRNPRQGSTFRA